jgi:hypothetical protein
LNQLAAPLGNQNAARAKKWREAIMRALARKSGSVEAGLDAAADKLAIMAIDQADKWALEEIGNRLDGKPAQAIVGDDDLPPVRTVTRIELVDLDDSGTDRTTA